MCGILVLTDQIINVDIQQLLIQVVKGEKSPSKYFWVKHSRINIG